MIPSNNDNNNYDERSRLLPNQQVSGPTALGMTSHDPAVVARAMVLISQQMADAKLRAQQAQPMPPVNAQHAIKLTEGDYTGDVVNGIPHGRGVLNYFPGYERKKYNGEWKEGKFHGRGELQFTNGNTISGEWVEGKSHGHVDRHFSDGARYEGQCANSQYHGAGEYRWAKGSFYKGEWVDGKKQGKGTYNFENGDVYIGDWKDNQIHGYGVYTYQNGSIYKGYWENAKEHGKGYAKWVNGEEYSGEWENGKMNGEGVYRENSWSGGVRVYDIFEGFMRNDKPWNGRYRHGGGQVVDGKWIPKSDCFPCTIL